MVEYKQRRIVDIGEKPRQVILNEMGTVIDKNPNEERLRSAIIWTFKHNSTNTCDRCGIKFEMTSGHPEKENDEKGNWTGKWDCSICHQKYDSNSQNNTKKLLRNCRTGNQNSNHESTKGDEFEILTSIWKKVGIVSIDNNKYCGPLDHSIGPEGIIYQTKGRLYDSVYQLWGFGQLIREWCKIFDYEICYCVSEDGNDIERIYVFPKKEIIKRKSISIYKNPINSRSKKSIIPWYDEYRIKNEETIKKVNELWKDIKKRKGRRKL